MLGAIFQVEYLKSNNEESDLFKDSKINNGVDNRNYQVNFSKVRESLGFIAENSIENGIAEILGELKNKNFTIHDKTSNFHGNYKIKFNNLWTL